MVYLSLGSNLGNTQENIEKALQLLSEKCKILNKSSLIETKPVGYVNQPDFLNGVVHVSTKLTPQSLLKFLKEIERKIGRTETFRNGPRIIDIDIIFYNNLVMETEELTIPHPRMPERLFVLQPLLELNPHLIHPKLQKTVKQLATVETISL